MAIKPLLRLVLLPALSLTLLACSGKGSIEAYPEGRRDGVQYSTSFYWKDAWQELSARLQDDGLDAQKTKELFDRLDTPPSLGPMGAKIKELYSNRFLAAPKRISKPQKKVATKHGIPGPWFDGVVTESNARKCLDFIRANRSSFARTEMKYGVPAEVAAALLFVETRLGTLLGREKAFYSLASMSVAHPPESIAYYLDGMPGMWDRLDWIRTRIDDKAQWAYRELKALLSYCFANAIDPFDIPGSRYGAIGMCQFMPSNLPRYAADGDGDSIINIFLAPDAIASLGNYLFKHGWRRALPLNGKVKALMRYNKMEKYAYTILALAKTIEEVERQDRRKGIGAHTTRTW